MYVLCFPETMRALYLGDNDFEVIPPEIGKLKSLQIVSNQVIKKINQNYSSQVFFLKYSRQCQ